VPRTILVPTWLVIVLILVATSMFRLFIQKKESSSS
jgi:hypothetical protein